MTCLFLSQKACKELCAVHADFPAQARKTYRNQRTAVSNNNDQDQPNTPEHNHAEKNKPTHMEDNNNNKAKPKVSPSNKITPRLRPSCPDGTSQKPRNHPASLQSRTEPPHKRTPSGAPATLTSTTAMTRRPADRPPSKPHAEAGRRRPYTAKPHAPECRHTKHQGAWTPPQLNARDPRTGTYPS